MPKLSSKSGELMDIDAIGRSARNIPIKKWPVKLKTKNDLSQVGLHH